MKFIDQLKYINSEYEDLDNKLKKYNKKNFFLRLLSAEHIDDNYVEMVFKRTFNDTFFKNFNEETDPNLIKVAVVIFINNYKIFPYEYILPSLGEIIKKKNLDEGILKNLTQLQESLKIQVEIMNLKSKYI